MPFVSVCIPTFNGEAYLAEALESAVAQTHPDLEILVVDDASRDGTVALARAQAGRDARVSVHVNTTNRGPIANWNACLDLAKGEWIKFLFQDDRLEPACVARMLAEAPPTVELVVCRRSTIVGADTPPALRTAYETYVHEHSMARRFPGASVVAPDAFAIHLLTYPTDNCIGEPVATMIRRSAVDRLGRFNPHLIQLVDWEYCARIATNTGIAYVDDDLVSFRLHGRSMTSESASARQYRKDVLDPLLILHEFVYSPAYASLRAAARRALPHLAVHERFVAARDDAHDLALRCPDADLRAAMLREWEDVSQSHPLLIPRPPGPDRSESSGA